jgi:hypothetical protein
MLILTPQQFADYLTGLPLALEYEVGRALRDTEEILLRTAREVYSRGPYSSATLRRLGHPYRRRGGAPPLPPEIINRQSGAFFDAWHGTGFVASGRSLGVGLENDSEEAAYLKTGTRKMIRRPVEKAVLGEAERAITRRFRDALIDAFTP